VTLQEKEIIMVSEQDMAKIQAEVLRMLVRLQHQFTGGTTQWEKAYSEEADKLDPPLFPCHHHHPPDGMKCDDPIASLAPHEVRLPYLVKVFKYGQAAEVLMSSDCPQQCWLAFPGKQPIYQLSLVPPPIATPHPSEGLQLEPSLKSRNTLYLGRPDWLTDERLPLVRELIVRVSGGRC